MKVLFLTGVFPDTQNPYSGVFVYNQVKALKKQGVDLSILYFDLRSIRKKRKWGLSKYRYKEVDVYQFAIPCGPIYGVHDFLLKKFASYAFKKVQKREGLFSLVHAHFLDMGLAARKIYEKNKVPYIVTEHSSSLAKNDLMEKEKKRARMAYEKAEKVIAVGSVLRDSIQSFINHEVVVVPNILSERFIYIPNKNKNSQYFHYISIGSLIPRKRMDILIKAFIKLAQYKKNICLSICGEGILMDELKQLTKEAHLETRINFLGIVDNDSLPDLLRSCDCFVLPSVLESFGVVYIEAAGCGLPIIAAESGGSYDIVNKDNGLIVKNDDIDDLVKAMAYIYDNYERYRSVEISENVRKKFGEETFVNTILDIYRSVEMEKG